MSQKKTEEQLKEFEHIIGYEFKDKSLLLEALTHCTFAHEARDKGIKDNQRLEFFGDAVLDMVVAEYLYKKYPDYNEGQLTRIKSHVVCTSVLSSKAGKLNLGQYLRLGRGEEATGGRSKKSNLAAGFESIIAALYFDGGLFWVSKFILQELESEIKLVQEHKSGENYKSLLQELTLKEFNQTPVYQIVAQTGPEHACNFKIEVKIKDEVYGLGQGSNRKSAEQAAAAAALKKLERGVQ